MPYLFQCPHCQTKTQVDDKYSGQSGECVTCGGEIQIPAFSAQENAADQAVDRKPLAWAVGGGVLLIILVCLGYAIFRFGGQTVAQLSANRQRSVSVKNLQKIASALNAYAKDYGTYPPPVTMDPKGRKLHSWRVLILPYIGEKELYESFDLEKAWDDPENINLAYNVPSVFTHPMSQQNGYYADVNYCLIYGDGTLFPPEGPLGPDDITDKVSQTILVTEAIPITTAKSWIEPVDLNYLNMKGQINGTQGVEIGGLFADGVCVATADGRAHFLPMEMAPMVVNNLITPNGGEPMADDTLD